MLRHPKIQRLLCSARAASCAVATFMAISLAVQAGELPAPPEEAKYPNILKPLYQIGTYGRLPGQFNNVIGVAYTAQGQLVLADTLNHRVQILERNGRPVTVFGGYGSIAGKFNSPQGVAVSDKGEIVGARLNLTTCAR